ncbi:MAG: UDP-N-acetylmuramate dehydrogenase [Clostridia bacterium]|nr:UDP-N-acetylmuramate dehydrogenase [Clostridia bacterium]
MKELLERLLSNGITCEYEENFDFAKHSTVGVGGKAKIAFYPKTLKETTRLCDFFVDNRMDFLVLGNISNTLPPDETLEIPIILTKKLKSMEFSSGVFVEAGVTSSALLDACQLNGKSGAEFLAGIPCTIGGAVYMNAGANGKYMSDIVKKVLIYKQKRLCLLNNHSCCYSYKKSVFMENDGVILGVELELKNSDEKSVCAVRKNVLQNRFALPKGKSMGCVFKNPLGDSAGRLIEAAGLKGLREGGAVVSRSHANFMLNEGGATQNDFLKLIRRVKNEVFKRFGVSLEEEIRVIIKGELNDINS